MMQICLPQANWVHLIRGQRNPKQKQPLDSFPRVLTTHTNRQHLTAHHCLERKTSHFHFSSFKRPNMLSLDRFQFCFNSLKSETKSAFTSLAASRSYVFLPPLPSSKGFIELSHGSLARCKCGPPQHTVGTKARGPAGRSILPVHRCVGSQNFLKLQKETTKASRWLRS